MRYFTSEELGSTKSSPYPMPETGVFNPGRSFRSERRTTRRLTSGGDPNLRLPFPASDGDDRCGQSFRGPIFLQDFSSDRRFR
jgi:hypothetical protein